MPVSVPGPLPNPALSSGARGNKGCQGAVPLPAAPGVAERLTLLRPWPHRLGLGINIPFTQRLAAPAQAGSCRPCLGGLAARIGLWPGPPERLEPKAAAVSASSLKKGQN